MIDKEKRIEKLNRAIRAIDKTIEICRGHMAAAPFGRHKYYERKILELNKLANEKENELKLLGE